MPPGLNFEAKRVSICLGKREGSTGMGKMIWGEELTVLDDVGLPPDQLPLVELSVKLTDAGNLVSDAFAADGFSLGGRGTYEML